MNVIKKLIAEKTKLTNALEEWNKWDLNMIRHSIKKNVTNGEDFEFNFCYGVHLEADFNNEYAYDGTYEYFIIAYQLRGDNPNELHTEMVTPHGMYGLGDDYCWENITYNGDDWRFLLTLKEAIMRGVEDFRAGIHNHVVDLF